MTIFIGDIHGDFEILHKRMCRPEIFEYPESIIQVGDFGHHPGWLKYHPFVAPPRKIYWIDGNHEWFPDLFGDSMTTPAVGKGTSPYTRNPYPRPAITVPTEIYPNCVYIPRGTVMEIDGRVMAFLGGGDSIDKNSRTKGWDWFPEERVQFEQVERLRQNASDFFWKTGKRVEVLVTHVPPLWLVPLILNSHHNNWGGPNIEANYSSDMVERAWKFLGKPTLVCGHFHCSFRHDNVHVLDINEFKEL